MLPDHFIALILVFQGKLWNSCALCKKQKHKPYHKPTYTKTAVDPPTGSGPFGASFNMFAANPTFARIGSRISLDMLKSMRRVSVFPTLQSLKPKNPKKRKP